MQKGTSMSLYALTVPTFTQLLNGLSAQLDKASEWAKTAGKSNDELMDTRLSEDMLPLSSQVRFVCGQARDSAAKLTGKDMPAIPEDIVAFDALKQLVAETLTLLGDLTEDDFAGDEDAMVELTIPNGMVFDLTRAQYARDWALPQIYFHATTAYAIMRHLGVELGKMDFVGHMLRYFRAPAEQPAA
ncbi:DUF1993 domain-containing protein [Alterisphingorhabdus coralli]|uniref:DUF1993 domain-containing protein n=1 Tax=Alterisphingorhabdus coralli TaxID=3071408 RepID=A0AA97F665_9SPHN|nr:DUF1993 domain-containing protein [Parasphingorhabdus sp. SCSIO 66989]WOE75119.1 DUF1993 domain-containing protein [Parasphingorhabdus sp. SCSIO 66989]